MHSVINKKKKSKKKQKGFGNFHYGSTSPISSASFLCQTSCKKVQKCARADHEIYKLRKYLGKAREELNKDEMMDD